jgi:hypothetical protein
MMTGYDFGGTFLQAFSRCKVLITCQSTGSALSQIRDNKSTYQNDDRVGLQRCDDVNPEPGQACVAWPSRRKCSHARSTVSMLAIPSHLCELG